MVWGRNISKAEALAQHLADQPYKVAAVTDLAAAVGKAEIVSGATLSMTPLIKGEWLSPGTHLDLVGGFRPTMREADDSHSAFAGICRIPARARKEAGDIIQPINSGVLDPKILSPIF